VTPLTLKLIQVGFLVLLWLMVLSVAAVMRGDMYARRRAKPPKPPKAHKVARPVSATSVAGADAAAGSLAAAGAGSAAGATAATVAVPAAPAAPAKPPKPAKPRRGAARTLQVTAGTREGTTIELGASPITIGRLPENTVVLEDDYVSGRHARLYPHEGAWVVEDLGSTNGTYLDRTRLTAPMVLPIGTPVRIGKTVLELRK
jgi:FHA domain